MEFVKEGVPTDRWYGIAALLLGWQGFFVEQFGWFANPVLLIAYILILFRQFVAAAVFAGLAVVIAATSVRIIGQTLPADEGNVTHMQVTAFDFGYYVWIASLIAAVIVPIIAAVIVKARKSASVI